MVEKVKAEDGEIIKKETIAVTCTGMDALREAVYRGHALWLYISCNPVTLERDLGYMTRNGYRVGEIQPVDMFPQTAHVETVVLMSRVK